MAQDDSIRNFIQDAKGKPRAEIEKEVWAKLSPETQERLGRVQLRRLIAAELNDPDQFELLIDGEPLPLDEVESPSLLRERGYRLIKMGKSAIRRGEAYLAEYDRRMADKKRGG